MGKLVIMCDLESKEQWENLFFLHRHLMGEELDSLSLKELQNLEQQIDMALKHIRSRKVINNIFLQKSSSVCKLSKINDLIFATSNTRMNAAKLPTKWKY